MHYHLKFFAKFYFFHLYFIVSNQPKTIKLNLLSQHFVESHFEVCPILFCVKKKKEKKKKVLLLSKSFHFSINKHVKLEF